MALGKSLGNILGDYFGQETVTLGNQEPNFDKNTQVSVLPIDKISPSPFQTRSVFEENKIEKLAESIKESGLIHPILVLKKEKASKDSNIQDFDYTLLAGERRLRACKLLGYTEILAIIKPFDSLTSKQQAMLAAVENLQREDLSPIEMAGTFLMLMQTQNFDEQELADNLGHSLQYIKNYIRLLTLDKKVQQSLLERKIGEGQARYLVGLDPNLQTKLLDRILAEDLTVKEIIEIVRKIKEPTENKARPDKTSTTFKINPKTIVKVQKLAEIFPNATLKCTGSDDEGKIVISWKKNQNEMALEVNAEII